MFFKNRTISDNFSQLVAGGTELNRMKIVSEECIWTAHFIDIVMHFSCITYIVCRRTSIGKDRFEFIIFNFQFGCNDDSHDKINLTISLHLWHPLLWFLAPWILISFEYLKHFTTLNEDDSNDFYETSCGTFFPESWACKWGERNVYVQF